MITILSWGGIGDTLRNIGLVPHAFLFRKFGIRCRVVYLHWKLTGALEHANPPEPDFFRELVERCPSLVWGGEIKGRQRAGRIVSRAVRELVKFFHHNAPRYFPCDFRLTPEERSMLPERAPGFVVGVQTHLSGMKTKQWGLANWQTYLHLLLAGVNDLSIVLFDSEAQVEQLCGDPRIRSTRGLNIAQSIALIEQLDLLVSIDSWSKYVAASRKIPQLIVVPDQRSEYPELSAQYLARNSFEGIFDQPQNAFIGLSGTQQAPQLTLDRIADLTPQQLAKKTLEMIRAVRH
ncbi:MAG: hypothetical protein WCI40_07150 [Verrucomicrobiota bacterium]